MSINLANYDYHLPKDRIAQAPHRPRDQCKLLIIKNNHIIHEQFNKISNYLHPGDVLVINETKVDHCKIKGQKKTGGKIEVVLTQPLGNNIYECRIKGRKLKVGLLLIFPHHEALITKQDNDIFQITCSTPIPPEDLEIITPPYIKEKINEEDYQTVFAKTPGSLAAPTAGLHFTNRLLTKIQAKGIKIAKVQLHISFDTFLPIRDLKNHQTGTEQFAIDPHNANIINSGRIIAVGTTVVKCLESATWNSGKIEASTGESHLFIKPGHKFKASIKAMITNFHLPKSSLLLLTSAYLEKDLLLKVYHEALKHDYKFFSLGDAMMIIKE